MLNALRERLLPAQLRRDLDMIVRGFVGERVSPFVTRDKARPVEPATKSHTRRVVIAEVRRETPDAVSLVLRDPTGRPLPFEAGQFFTIARDVGGEVLKRAYSASSSALVNDTVTVTVKRVEGGRMSNELNDRARAGDVMELLGPSGSFVAASWQNDLVLVGGGSGITPLMSIARTVLASRPRARVTLVFGNRGEDDVIFRDALAELAREHEGRFEVRHVLETAGSRITPSRAGRLDEEVLAASLDDTMRRTSTTFFICGPEPVMAAAERVLEANGIDRERVKTERFSSLRAAQSASEPEEVTVVAAGSRRSLTVAPGETILEAAMRSDVTLPFSCTVGGCGACRVRLVSGDVALDEPNCLDASERREGYVLSCVSRPLGPVSIEVE